MEACKVTKAWQAEIELVANLIVNDLAYAHMAECFCGYLTCDHEPMMELWFKNIHGDDAQAEFIDSETVRAADDMASMIRRIYIKAVR
jgi:hypothetical protein